MELALKPSLLSVLKIKLDEAQAQVRMEEFGRGVMDTLQVLSVLSALPDDGEDLETGDQLPLTAACNLMSILKTFVDRH